jgi:hypothetical protein
VEDRAVERSCQQVGTTFRSARFAVISCDRGSGTKDLGANVAALYRSWQVGGQRENLRREGNHSFFKLVCFTSRCIHANGKARMMPKFQYSVIDPLVLWVNGSFEQVH